jgi:hypothetical protein
METLGQISAEIDTLEAEQKAGVRKGKPDFSFEEPMLSTGLHFASESTPLAYGLRGALGNILIRDPCVVTNYW